MFPFSNPFLRLNLSWSFYVFSSINAYMYVTRTYNYVRIRPFTYIHMYVEIKPVLWTREWWILYWLCFHSRCQYEPELFPGLIYRMKQPKIVLLIFVSGKIVLTGAKVISLVFFCSALTDFICHSCWSDMHCLIFYSSGQRWDLYSLWEHIPSSYRVQEKPAMVRHLIVIAFVKMRQSCPLFF